MEYSIITPVYNREDCVSRCIESVMRQTLRGGIMNISLLTMAVMTLQQKYVKVMLKIMLIFNLFSYSTTKVQMQQEMQQ